MEWVDEGFVLSVRKHGETSAVIDLLTRNHGRHAGLVRGGNGKRLRGVLQPGNRIHATWRARLPEHLGNYSCELTHATIADVMDDPIKLAAVSAACAVGESALPERQAYPRVFNGFEILLDSLNGEFWPTVYVKWEMGLLGEIGFGLDLSCCVATGTNNQLAYVSPKSGRAVSLAAGEPYKEKLLALPAFLVEEGTSGSWADLRDALALTGFFLNRHVFVHRENAGKVRARLTDLVRERAKIDA